MEENRIDVNQKMSLVHNKDIALFFSRLKIILVFYPEICLMGLLSPENFRKRGLKI